MKTRSVLLAFLLITTGFAQAQVRAHLGANTGITTTFLFDDGLKTDPQYVSVQTYETAPLGFSFGVDFTKKFGLQLESILANQQMVFEIADAVKTSIGERKIDMRYVQIPMLLRFMGGGDQKARMNFNFGPQLSILQGGLESFNVNEPGARISVPDGAIDELPAKTIDNMDGTYTLPDDLPQEGFSSDLLKKNAENKIESFKNKEFHIVGGFGLDVDLSKNLYMGINVRADYSLTDMRNGDLIEELRDGNLNDIFSSRSTLTVGAQISLNFMIGGVRSYKEKAIEEEGELEFR